VQSLPKRSAFSPVDPSVPRLNSIACVEVLKHVCLFTRSSDCFVNIIYFVIISELASKSLSTKVTFTITQQLTSEIRYVR